LVLAMAGLTRRRRRDPRTTSTNFQTRPDSGSTSRGAAMGRLDRIICACTAFVVTCVLTAVAVAEQAKPRTPPVPAAERQAQARGVVPLSRLHHVAQGEIALGLLAQVAAVRPETMWFATDLETDFRELDRHIIAIAEALGIEGSRLRQAYAADDTAALNRQKEDLDRLSMASGAEFDRQFWVTVDRDQRAASALLASASGTVPSLDPLIAETVRLLDRSIRRAAAAQARSNTPPVKLSPD
jgi:hypothetical protein